MGCACFKASSSDDGGENPGERLSNKLSANLWSARTVSLTREGNYRLEDLLDDSSNRRRVILKNRQLVRSAGLNEESFVRKKEMVEYAADHPGVGMVPRAIEGELVAVGWPPWLAAVAGDAIIGWVPRSANSFEKLDKIGQGTYSRVYRARDLDEGKLVALKKVGFDNLDPESVRFMAREILILRRLDHPNVIKLEGLITSRMSCSLYLIFKYMEHDLTGLESLPGLRFTEPQIKCYMKQLLLGLDHCHTQGVLHRDIKGTNLLIDDNGTLKIADFGLASLYDPHQCQPLTSRVVTLWYRPPELLLGATHYGDAVDLWSSGCILAELYAGKPIMPGRTEVEQLHKIFKLCGSPSEEYWRTSKLPRATIFKPQQQYKRRIAKMFKDLPAPVVALIERLLSIDPADRGSAASALKSEFFTTAPLPCDPSSLPKYPPSKEFDAKLWGEEAQINRQAMAESKGSQRHDHGKRGSRECRPALALDADTESISSMQKRQGRINPKSWSTKLVSRHEQVASGFQMRPSRSPPSVHEAINSHPKRASRSGPLVNPDAWPYPRKIVKNAPRKTVVDDLSRMFSDSVGPKPITRFPGPLKSTTRHHEIEDKRSSNDPVSVGYRLKVNRIRFSGPLPGPLNKVDPILNEHDHRIQEAVR